MSKILLVEDDDQFRDMMTQMLRQDQHQLVIAKNGREALNMLQKQQVDLIITDILMPELDGIELIRTLHATPHSPPIIALSGGRRTLSADFNLESAALLGVATTLSKPFSRDVLREAIKEALI